MAIRPLIQFIERSPHDRADARRGLDQLQVNKIKAGQVLCYRALEILKRYLPAVEFFPARRPGALGSAHQRKT